MSTASIYTGQNTLIPVINALGNTFEEWQLATAGQTVFTIVSFQYTPGTNTLLVFKNGLLQRIGVDYIEINSTTVTFAAGFALNDRVCFFAWATSGTAIPNGGGVPVGGTTGQALVKTSNADYAAGWTSLTALASLLDSPRVSVASAATVNLTSLVTTTRNIQITGSVNITGFQLANGQLFAVRFAAALTLIASANLVTQSGVNVKVQAGDTCFIRATADNVVEILSYASAIVNYGGRLINTQSFSVSGTYTPSTGTNVIIVEAIGGGGQGGGANTTAAAQVSSGQGGASGSRSVGRFVVPGVVAVTIGAGGSSAASGTGQSGGTTTFGASLSAPGGTGGVAVAAAAFNAWGATPGGGFGSGGNILTVNGNSTRLLVTQASVFPFSQAGADTIYGSGGSEQTSNADGQIAGGAGAGGGGGLNGPSQATLRRGGSGQAGLCIVYEYT